MNKDNLNTMIAYPQKPVIASTISTNTTTSTDMAELEQLRKENKRLQEKLEEYVLKDCMSRVDSLTYSATKMDIKYYLDEGNPIKVLVECFRYSNNKETKKLYDTYGFDMIIKAIRSLFAEDDKEDD